MNKKELSGSALRLIVSAAVIMCMMLICAGTVYADDPELLPNKNEKGVYEIYTPEQFTVFLNLACGRGYSIDGKTVTDYGCSGVLMADIDYDGVNINYLPSTNLMYNEQFAFAGTLDGNGHSVKYIPQDTYRNYCAFIGYNKGTIKNLVFDAGNVSINSNYLSVNRYGIFLGRNMASGIISGVTVKADITSNMRNQAIFCGYNYGVISNCSTEGTLKCTSGSSECAPFQYGAIDGGKLENFYNAADITIEDNSVTPYGISIYGSEDIKNCYNCGAVTKGGFEVDKLSNDDSLLVNCYKATDEFTAADLGDAFVDDLEGEQAVNNGYPVFPYQIGGEFPHVECIDDLTIKAIKDVSETSLTFTTDTPYTYFKPKAGDFSIIASNESGVSVDIQANDLSWGSRSKTIYYKSLYDAKDEDGVALIGVKAQTITIKVKAAGQVLAETSFDAAGSDDWRDYAVEPELLSPSDSRYDGKFGGYYMITTPEELAWFATHYRTDMSAFLANDIDLAGHKWHGIGRIKSSNNTVAFTGTFDGNGYKVTNMYSETSGALVYYLGGGTVKNVCVEDSYVESPDIAGGIVTTTNNTNGGRIENCSFSGEIVVAGGTSTSRVQGAGGIVGATYEGYSFSIVNCANYARVNGRQPSKTGGIIGYSGSNPMTIENCYNMGETNGAGIIGDCYSSYHPTVKNCYNAGKAKDAIATTTYCNISDCYSLARSGKVSGDVSVFTDDDAKDGTLVEYLGTEAYAADVDNINNGYPVLKWQDPLTAALENYPDEIKNYVDLSDYGMNGAEVQAVIDEAVEKIANAKTSAEADAILAEAKAKIDAIPNDEQAKQNMADALAALQEQIIAAGKTLAFDMCQISIDSDSFEYSGTAFEPVVTVTDKDGKALVKDTDYEVRYEANVEPGFAKVIVSGKGNYAGDREIKFTITPAKVQGLKLKKAKKAFTAKWTSDEKAVGYEVSYSLKKNFKGAKTVKITKSTTVSKKVSKLKAKKKYFVRVRAYVTADEQTVYGAWSPVKSVKTK